MKIFVVGAGAWGTALAIRSCEAQQPIQVTLWARDAAQRQTLASTRLNTRYLPGIELPKRLQIAQAARPLADIAAEQSLVVLAVPVAAIRSLLLELQDSQAPIVWLSKGFEAPQMQTQPPGAQHPEPLGLLVHEIHAQLDLKAHVGILSGPSFAQEVAAGLPAALVAASVHASVRDLLVAAFHGPALRIYPSDDITGVEVGGAVKNVLAIATGLCDGLQLGLNARAALITRGLAEMTRLGVALGARAETFTGLSGLGDLVLTATGDLSRNRQVGLLLAQGKSLAEAVASLGHVAEGVYSARTVCQRAASLGVDMPIAQSVVALLDGYITPAQALAQLMGREPATSEQG